MMIKLEITISDLPDDLSEEAFNDLVERIPPVIGEALELNPDENEIEMWASAYGYPEEDLNMDSVDFIAPPSLEVH